MCVCQYHFLIAIITCIKKMSPITSLDIIEDPGFIFECFSPSQIT